MGLNRFDASFLRLGCNRTTALLRIELWHPELGWEGDFRFDASWVCLGCTRTTAPLRVELWHPELLYPEFGSGVLNRHRGLILDRRRDLVLDLLVGLVHPQELVFVRL